MASVYLFLDKRRVLANGNFKIRLRVTENRKSIYFTTNYSVPNYTKKGKVDETFEAIQSGKNLTSEFKAASKDLKLELSRAYEIIKELEPFSFKAFKTRFSAKGNRNDIIDLLKCKSVELLAKNQISSSNLYKQASQMFLDYAQSVLNTNEILTKNVNSKLLKDVETWANNKEYKKLSLTTIGMYMVRTKAVINEIIKTSEFSKAKYPFGKKDDGLYSIPKSKNSKRPLTIEEIMQVYNFDATSETQKFAKDIFLFSYLASGMNLADIFKLKFSNFDKDRFTFIRQKTAHKKSDLITVLLNEDLKAIIDRHSQRVIGNDYVFNVLNPGMNKIEANKALRCAVTSINQALKIIAKKLDIPQTISTYYARHSFSNILMQSEAPLAFISQS
ncbi:hypothetical protein A5893_03045 [Pedobacter psychrophilus]|uniref:Tyr recombinase domain-containing protein n=1 Tax=Pedobacter psychrophilus TaxID=1826909 RepID=A0A179DM28_9SPHI|nr:tyrosine-type recombinase/integrase [Pedobacter psychrophilus]OAQ42106.1 hypothetical protein A5893_03045 [Pedobacter psychrophilus]